MKRMADVSSGDARKRLLAATERLIYAEGICATGMDRIVRESGVARKTVYRYFRTKEELVAEALRERDARWMRWFIDTCHQADTPDGRLLAAFDALEAWFSTPDFRGCAFINAAGEVGDADAVIRRVAREHKLKLRDFLSQLAREHGAAHPEELAAEFLILIDGAITVALVLGHAGAARDARRLAQRLLSSSCPPSPS
ncbi:MAG: helix-turn-helix domain-containing protein [Cystobacter sp.]